MFGYVIRFNETPILFKTKKQNLVSLSSTESEFIGIAEIGKKLMWLKNVLNFMKMKHEKIKVYNDNNGSIKMAKSSSSMKRTKHINIRYFYIQGLLQEGEFDLEHVRTDENVADTFTKSLGKNKFKYFAGKMLA